ncbi:MAG: redoxin domain-containing protein [Bacteroidota bacterium]
MFRRALLSTTIVLLTCTVYAQKTFNLTLKFDSTINPKRVWYRYDNGKDPAVTDTIHAAQTAIITGEYYSPLIAVTIGYIDTTHTGYTNDFFISDKPASITLHYKPNTNRANNEWQLGYTSINNATVVFDTLDNKHWGRIIKMRETYSKDVAAPLYTFTQQNPNYNKNDSLRTLFNLYFKAYTRRDMSYLKQYPDDYYSFWFFINQSSQLNQLLSDDKAFLQEQLAFAKSTFPKFINSIEGKALVEKFEHKIKAVPLVMNQPAPAFMVVGVDGKTISLTQLKGRYVLLDFWATWCGPCMAEMPFVKDIRKKYPAEKLAMIGISWDTNKQNLLDGIRKNNMTWPQYLDQGTKIGTLYNIIAIPKMILLDKEGRMIFHSANLQSDQITLTKLLDSLN